MDGIFRDPETFIERLLAKNDKNNVVQPSRTTIFASQSSADKNSSNERYLEVDDNNIFSKPTNDQLKVSPVS